MPLKGGATPQRIKLDFVPGPSGKPLVKPVTISVPGTGKTPQRIKLNFVPNLGPKYVSSVGLRTVPPDPKQKNIFVPSLKASLPPQPKNTRKRKIPKKHLTPWNKYVKDNFKRVQEKNPKKCMPAITKLLGEEYQKRFLNV